MCGCKILATAVLLASMKPRLQKYINNIVEIKNILRATGYLKKRLESPFYSLIALAVIMLVLNPLFFDPAPNRVFKLLVQGFSHNGGASG